MNTGVFREVHLPPRWQPVAEVPLTKRLPEFIGLQVDPEIALRDFSLGIVGLGSVGRNIADKIARLKIGALYAVDPGKLKPESLLTYPVGPEEVRKAARKARSAALLCRKLSPSTRTFYYDGPIEQMGPSALAEADLAVMATDNLAAEIEVADRCARLRVPLLQAAVHGDSLVAQVRFYTNADANGPCLFCSLTREERRLLNNGVVFSCTGIAGDRQAAQRGTMPTMSTAFLCSLAADLALTVILRRALKLGPPLTDCQIELCGYTMQTVVTPLRPRPETCECDHRPWTVKRLDRPLGDATLRELAAAAGLGGADGSDGLSFVIDNLLFADRGGCAGCGHHRVRRFVAPGRKAGVCRICGGGIYAQEYYSHRPVLAADIEDVLDVPLRRIGGARAQGVLARRGDEAVLLCNPTQ